VEPEASGTYEREITVVPLATEITPVADIQHFVSLIDKIVETRPNLPPLVIAVTSADGCETARKFLGGYHQRLSVNNAYSLVPHALADGGLLNIADTQFMPDVELLNRIASELHATMPPGTGSRRWASFFQTCYDVITAEDVQLGQIVDQQRQLLDHLYRAWEARTPLAWIQRMAASSSTLDRRVGLVATLIFSGPIRWWFGRRLNRNRMRWFGEHLTPITGRQGDFLTQALSVVPVGEQHDNAALRLRILLDALLHDLDCLTRRRRFLPHRRRRRWTPVLSLDCTGKEGLACLDIVQCFNELTVNRSISPLLVIAAMEPDGLEFVADTPNAIKDAVKYLQDYINHTTSALTNTPWLPVLLPSGPEDRVASDWLKTHRKVIPRVPGNASAWTPIAILTVIAIGATAIITYQYVSRNCKYTWSNSLGEQVGLTDGTCEFTQMTVERSGLPYLPNLERAIKDNNSKVDAMKDVAGAPRDYRYVVFFAPLTRPVNVPERTAPANALWQLRGAIEAQRRLNDDAMKDANKVPIKLLLANSGDLFQDGPDVASVIAKQPQSGPGSIAAVIGISQSRTKSRESFERMPDIPVIGASVTGSNMTTGEPNFFVVSPSNDVIAKAMIAWISSHGPQGGYTSATIEYDPNDTYFSKDLHDKLRDYLPEGFLKQDILLGEQGSPDGAADSTAAKLCNSVADGTLPILTGRADQLAKLLTDANNEPMCNGKKITMLAGYGAVVAVASGQINQYEWLNLAYAAVADNAVASDEATGNDALVAASDAINKAALASGNNPNSKGVLYQLSLGLTVNGKTGTFTLTPEDHKDSRLNRVKIIETRPNS
jgi:hypothetical protein